MDPMRQCNFPIQTNDAIFCVASIIPNVSLNYSETIGGEKLYYSVSGEKGRALPYDFIIVLPRDEGEFGCVTVQYADGKNQIFEIKDLPFQDVDGLKILLFAIDNHRPEDGFIFTDQNKEELEMRLEAWVAQGMARGAMELAGQLNPDGHEYVHNSLYYRVSRTIDGIVQGHDQNVWKKEIGQDNTMK